MIYLLEPKMMPELLNLEAETYISLYMPTHKSHPENQQDLGRFKILVGEIEESLSSKYSASEVEQLLKPFHDLANDFEFWQNTEKGLAVLRTKDFFKVIGLQTPVDQLAVVSDSFHSKPLRKYLQTLEPYNVLAVSLHRIQFYEGNRHALVEVELASEVPATITEALGEELTEKHLIVSSGASGVNGPSIHHGQGSKSDEVDKDAERFFTVVSRAIAEHYSNPSGLPLILAALPEHHNLFQKVSNNPQLLPGGIMLNPESLSIDQLKRLSWEIIEPEYFKRLDTLGDQFQQAKANGFGSDILEDVARAAAEGRVDTILLENDRIIPGKVNEENGEVKTSDLRTSRVDDLLDDIGELVVKKGGRVVVFPVDRMPTHTGIAAMFRY